MFDENLSIAHQEPNPSQTCGLLYCAANSMVGILTRKGVSRDVILHCSSLSFKHIIILIFTVDPHILLR